jgi:FMN phosphatase YigB (HAD superfamily)
VITRLLVCDLDNTLYDWVRYFVPAFYAMIDEVVRITRCDRERLLDDFREVHRMYHDSEHPFALLETRTIRMLYPGRSRHEVAADLDSAFHAFNSVRKSELQLYPGVRETLDEICRAGVVLVAHTESKLHAVIDRLTRLELTHYFRRIYCRERAQVDHPNPAISRHLLDEFPMEKVSELSHHKRKPDPAVLLEICQREQIAVKAAAYVGDSLVRDVLLARGAGVFAIWAKYGIAHKSENYQRLIRITHWTEDDLSRERALSEAAQSVQPDYVLEQSFGEIIEAIHTFARIDAPTSHVESD